MLAEGPGRYQGVEGVRHADHVGDQIVVLEALRFSRTVERLVMTEDGVETGKMFVLVIVGDEQGGINGMQVDDFAIAVGQFALFVDDLKRHARDADVVQQGQFRDLDDLFSGEGQIAGHAYDEGGDGDDVMIGVGVILLHPAQFNQHGIRQPHFAQVIRQVVEKFQVVGDEGVFLEIFFQQLFKIFENEGVSDPGEGKLKIPAAVGRFFQQRVREFIALPGDDRIVPGIQEER